MATSDNILHLSQDNWDRVITYCPKTVLVCFMVSWCPHSRMMIPVLESVARVTQSNSLIGVIDAQKEESLVIKYEVRRVPQVLVLVGGEIAERFPGGVVSEESMLASLGRMALRRESKEATLLGTSLG